LTISNLSVAVLITNEMKNTLVREHTSFNNFAHSVTFLRLRVFSTLKQTNPTYPQSSIELKLLVKQCRVTKIVKGSFGSTKLPIMYTVPAEGFLQDSTAEVMKFSFSQFSYEPTDCTLDTG
jgi:hypothetical protein